jgi:hypothetical protein
MKIPPKHLLIESLVIWGLAFYLAMAMAVLVGIILWLFGEQEVVFKAAWVRWCAIIAGVPVVLHLVRRTQTRIIFDRTAWRAGWQKHRRVTLPDKEPLQHTQKEQRHHPRCSVEYPVRASTDHGHGGFAMIADLSAKGCRVKSKAVVSPGEFGKLLIYVPTGMTPVTVSLTSVRWVNGHECGLEFILMDLDEQGCLHRCLAHAKNQLEPAVARAI